LARVVWATADNALQIHGGNGYATEYQISRVRCDARILNIFEGAAEIQAQVNRAVVVGGIADQAHDRRQLPFSQRRGVKDASCTASERAAPGCPESVVAWFPSLHALVSGCSWRH
jgi:hypothetical protein